MQPACPIPGAEHTHVYRTLEDVWAINKAITELTEKLGRKVNAVTIGGGLLGLESAAGTEQLGATPIVINGSPWLMNTQLDEGAGQALGRLIEAKGFEVHGGVFPSEVLVRRRRPGHRGPDGRRPNHRLPTS